MRSKGVGEDGFTPPANFAQMMRRGAIFLITRRGEDFHAQWLSPVAIFPCEGNREAESAKALAAALENGRFQEVARLYGHNDIAEERCWLSAPGWCLAYG